MRNARVETFDAVIDGRECQIEFTRVTVWSRDAHYGADADGNRGVPMDFIDDDYAEDVTVDIGDRVVPLAGLIDAWGERLHIGVDLPKLVLTATDAYIQRTEPTCDDSREPNE